MDSLPPYLLSTSFRNCDFGAVSFSSSTGSVSSSTVVSSEPARSFAASKAMLVPVLLPVSPDVSAAKAVGIAMLAQSNSVSSRERPRFKVFDFFII